MIRFIVAILVLSSIPSMAQTSQAAPEYRRGPVHEVQRNFTLEKAVLARSRRLEAFIQPGDRVKLARATRAVFNRLASGGDHADPYVLAQQELRSRFARLSAEQSDLLSYYILAGVARLLSHPEQWKENLAGMNEMSEMTSLRLQMMMDRRSKFISTLSSIMKKIATTQDTLVQNIK